MPESTWAAFITAPPYTPECRSRSPVRTSTDVAISPRAAVAMAGVFSSTIIESNTTAQSASPRSSRIQRMAEREPTSSSPSTRKRTFTGSSSARAISQATWSSGRKFPLSSAAPRA